MAEVEPGRDRRRNELDAIGDNVRANVKRLREARSLSTGALSQRLGDMGRPIQPSGITKIETGDRRVDVDDLVALAVALRVNPSALLLPPSIDEEIRVTGVGRPVMGFQAWWWADGKA